MSDVTHKETFPIEKLRTAWVPLAAYLPFFAATIAWDVSHRLSWKSLAGLNTAGLFFWTLLEYVLHRHMGHMRLPTPLMRLIRREHGDHHRWPVGPSQIVTRPSYSLPLAALTALFIWAGFRSWDVFFNMTSGVLIGYLAYEYAHYHIHVGLKKGPLFSWLRAYHFHHHFRNAAARFGVTSPIWDYVFRSR